MKLGPNQKVTIGPNSLRKSCHARAAPFTVVVVPLKSGIAYWMYGVFEQIRPPSGPGIPPAVVALWAPGTPSPAGKQVVKLR